MGPAIKRQEHYPIKTAAAAPPTGRSESSWRTEPLVGRCAEAGEKLSDDPENYGLFLFADPDQTRSSPIRFFAQHFLEPQYYYSTKSLVDCDVLTYVYEGSLELSGRSGKIASIEEGGVLRISQGPDAVHALDNSDARLACFMRIVIAADAAGIDATYEIKTFSETEKRGRWRLIASRGGRDGSIALRADVNVYASLRRRRDGASRVDSQPRRMGARHIWRAEDQRPDHPSWRRPETLGHSVDRRRGRVRTSRGPAV